MENFKIIVAIAYLLLGISIAEGYIDCKDTGNCENDPCPKIKKTNLDANSTEPVFVGCHTYDSEPNADFTKICTINFIRDSTNYPKSNYNTPMNKKPKNPNKKKCTYKPKGKCADTCQKGWTKYEEYKFSKNKAYSCKINKETYCTCVTVAQRNEKTEETADTYVPDS